MGIADQLRPIAVAMLGDPPPVAMRFWDGSTVGGTSDEFALHFRNRRALSHLLWGRGELGLARAYVTGDLEIEGDLHDVIRLTGEAITGRDAAFTLAERAEMVKIAARSRLIGLPPRPPVEEAHVRGRRGGAGRDRKAVTHHYDVGNDFYRLFLGPSMVYSCAYWRKKSLDLTEAQEAKLALIGRKLGLKSGMRVLDIGCGWGSMAIHAATLGCRVVGVTLSRPQADLAQKRAAEAGVGDLVEIRVQDYRDVSDGPFDAVSSIGMSEHVGLANLDRYVSVVAGLLRPGGRFMNHAITKPGAGGIPRDSFIGRYIFPDGELVEAGRIVSSMHAAGLEVRDVENLREHYAKTLRCWSANLDAGGDEAVRLTSETRTRAYRLYLAGSAVQFERGLIGLHQILAVKPHPDGRSDIPPTRSGWA